MEYYRIDDKVFFSQESLIKYLREGEAYNEDLSDDFLLNEAHTHNLLQIIEFNLNDCTYKDVVSSFDMGYVEKWVHNDTKIEFFIDVNFIRDEDSIRTSE